MALVAAAGHARAPEARVEPRALVLGAGGSAEVTVHSEGALRSAANLGSLAASPSDPGATRFTYSPPGPRAPQLAVLLFAAEDEEELLGVTVLELPLLGRLDLPVTTEPGASVRVEIAGATFGPVVADSRGKASIAIEVPPGATSAQVHAESRGKTTTRAAAIDAAPPSPPAALFLPEPMHPERGGWLLVAHPEADGPDRIAVELEGGTLSAGEPIAGAVAFKVVPDRAATELRARVSLAGGAQGSSTAAQARLSRELPTPLKDLGRFTPALSVGAARAGGGFGFAAGVGLGFRLPILGERLHLEAAGGARSARLNTQGLVGTFQTDLLAFPVELSVRGRVFRQGPWVAYLRGGAGLVPFSHTTRGGSQPDFSEAAVSYQAVAAIQVSRRFERVELFAELHGLLSPLETRRLEADASGLGLALGVRVAVP